MKKWIGTLLLCTGLLSGTAAFAEESWMLVQGSDKHDVNVFCYEGNKLVWGIYPRHGTSDNQVAREVYISHGTSGRTVLRFKRGFTTADESTTYVAASTVSCEVSPQ
jgi:hypothetical protein